MEGRTPSSAGTAGFPLGRWAWIDFVFLAVFVLGIYATRISLLPIRGEESRRGVVAMEMARTGEWILPRIQGEPYFSRPPLQNWLIAGFAWLGGAWDAAAIRWPSVLAVLGATLLVYWYGRTFQSRAGALASALVLATMGQVLQLGRLGETDMLFACLLAAAILVWHGGYARRWPLTLVWSISYALAALAMLTKGIQAPVYFVASVGLFLLCRRDWRTLLSPAHLLGIGVFLVLWGAWQYPYSQQMNAVAATTGAPEASSIAVYTKMIAIRFGDVGNLASQARHLALYPLNLLACLLPWSIFLPVYFDRRVRRRARDSREHLLFLAGAIAITFPTVWIPMDSDTRYFMPMYPMFALLIGWVLEQTWSQDAEPGLAAHWTRFRRFASVVVPVVGMVPLVLAIWPIKGVFLGGLGSSCLFLLFAAAVTAVLIRPRRGGVVSLAAIALFLGVSYNDMVLSAINAHSMHGVRERVEEAKAKIPDDVRLVSLGPCHHLFLYYYGEHVARVPADPWNEDVVLPNGVEYFCLFVLADRDVTITPAWEEIARIPCYRTPNRAANGDIVIVGRRLPPPEADRAASATDTGPGVPGAAR